MKYPKHEHKTLDESLKELLAKAKDYPISIKTILSILGGKGRIILLILFSLPFCQPIQIPGFSLPFGIAIFFIGLRFSFAHDVWLPKFVLKKRISPSALKKIVEKVLWLFKKIKPWLHPRLTFLCDHPVMHVLNGILIAFMGFLLALPLPIPLSNILIAWPILLMSLGLLEEDGLFVIISYLLTAASLTFFIALGFSFKVLTKWFSYFL